MSEAKTVKFQVYLPENLRTRFKAKCVMSGTTMNKAAIKLIEAWTDKDELPASNGKPEPTNAKESDATAMLPQAQPQSTDIKELVDRLGVKLMKEGINPMRVRELALGAVKPNKREQDLLLRLSGLDELPQ